MRASFDDGTTDGGTTDGGTTDGGTFPLHPGGPPRSLRFEKTNGCPNGRGLTKVQSFKCAKSKVPFPDARAVKSENGWMIVCFCPGVV